MQTGCDVSDRLYPGGGPGGGFGGTLDALCVAREPTGVSIDLAGAFAGPALLERASIPTLPFVVANGFTQSPQSPLIVRLVGYFKP